MCVCVCVWVTEREIFNDFACDTNQTFQQFVPNIDAREQSHCPSQTNHTGEAAILFHRVSCEWVSVCVCKCFVCVCMRASVLWNCANHQCWLGLGGKANTARDCRTSDNAFSKALSGNWFASVIDGRNRSCVYEFEWAWLLSRERMSLCAPCLAKEHEANVSFYCIILGTQHWWRCKYVWTKIVIIKKYRNDDAESRVCVCLVVCVCVLGISCIGPFFLFSPWACRKSVNERLTHAHTRIRTQSWQKNGKLI